VKGGADQGDSVLELVDEELLTVGVAGGATLDRTEQAADLPVSTPRQDTPVSSPKRTELN